MKLQLIFILTFVFFCFTTNAQTQIGTDIDGLQPGAEFGISTAMSADGSIVAIGSHNHSFATALEAGKVQVYQFDGINWNQLGQDFDGVDYWGKMGTDVSLSDDGFTLAIGIPETGNGSVKVYTFNGTTWIQQGMDIIGEAPADNFGESVSLSSDGSYLAVGAYGNDGNGLSAGQARVYMFNGTSWVQIGQDLDGEDPNDQFGTRVSLSSDGLTVAAGSVFNNGNGTRAGHVRVFNFNGTSWVQLGQDIDGEAALDLSGSNLVLSADGNIVAIGARFNSGSLYGAGHVRVFSFDGSNWNQLGNDIDGEYPDESSGVGLALSDDGNMVGIGSFLNSENGYDVGKTRIYQFNGTNWMKAGVDISGESEFDYSGFSVAMSSNGKKVAIGAFGNDGGGAGFATGSVRVFRLSGIMGQVYLDLNQNCVEDTSEIGIPQRTVVINPGNYTVSTDSKGWWSIDSLPNGTYTVTADTGSLWSLTCPIPQSITVASSDTLLIVDPIGVVAKYPCSAPDVSIAMPFMRPCFTQQYIYVQACNTNSATQTLNNAIVEVTLDSLIIPTAFELPEIDLGNNRYQFNLDSLVPGECVEFKITATVDCQTQLGQALCMKAELLPLDACALDSIPDPFPPGIQPCNTPWDNSSLSVSGYCQNDTVFFEITNNGAAMSCHSPVIVYLDSILHLQDSVLLNAQQTTVYSFPASAESWHLQVYQHPSHPGNSLPRATVENCGGFSGPTKINLFAQDDADPNVDIYCDAASASFDPNDKTGYPTGLTADNLLPANQQIQYRIRFQNTGTDTAFTVVIRDTLDSDLDIYSVRSGVSSHGYSFRLYGQRILEWTFDNIMLPDSNINEPASHGFVWFTVDQLPDLPDGTLITNSAGIYFDYNAPVITNTYQYHIGEPLISTSTVPVIQEAVFPFLLYPNPTSGAFTIDFGGMHQQVDIQITNINGQLLREETVYGKAQHGFLLDAAAGVYLVKVRTDAGKGATLKLVKMR